jgi:hypothetical protein
MPIPVTCACGQAFRAKDELAGKRIKCPKCGQVLDIPKPQGGEGESGASGLSPLDDLLRLDAAPMDPGTAANQLGAQPGPPAQLPQAGGFVAPGVGGFQPAFGQPAPSKSSSSGSKKTLMIALCGLGGFAVLAIGVLVLLLVSRGGDGNQTQSSANVAKATTPSTTAPTTTGPVNPATSAAKTISLAALSPVSLNPGGQAKVELRVERNGKQGPIQVQLEGAPAGITVKPPVIAASESVGQLELAAAATMGKEEVKTKIQVTVKVGDAQTTQPLEVTVKKFSLPSLVYQGDVLLQPGATAAVSLTVERNGYEGPLELRLEGVPPKIFSKVEPIAAGQNAAKVELTAALDAPDLNQKIRAVAVVQGQPISVEIPVLVEKEPFKVKAFMVVWLKPGESKTVQFPIERRSYKGPIHLEHENLPPGVTTPPQDIPADQPAATVVLTAAADAKELVRTVKAVSTAGKFTRRDDLVVRVTKGDSGLLPKDIATDPELSKLLKRGGFGGRLTTETKRACIDAFGGTKESEEAVLRGLRWLAAHQQPNGRWPLKAYSQGIDACDCWTKFEDKVVDLDTAGTALGVLPFLGAGVGMNRYPPDPPELSKYGQVVRKAISFLIRNQDEKTGNLGGTMYAHAMGTMALCEAYGMGGDEKVKKSAQLAIKYLLDGQDPKGGGWRYGPKQAGDMSVTGWVFLGIRNGQIAGLVIRPEPLTKAERFVESCAAGPTEGPRSRYSYEPGGKGDNVTMSAAGLLTRQYLGWKQQTPDLATGCKYLMENLPPEAGDQIGAIYYYYYATQVLHHMEGPEFDLWNYRIREHLIRTQRTTGHEAGSWNPNGCDHGPTGGRIYATSLALMTLEEYYRHLPLYRTLSRSSD